VLGVFGEYVISVLKVDERDWVSVGRQYGRYSDE